MTARGEVLEPRHVCAAAVDRRGVRLEASQPADLDLDPDACSIAWMQFLRYQPDRDRNWRAWLVTTAERVAWQLDRERYRTKSFDAEVWEPAHAPEPLDPVDHYRQRDQLEPPSTSSRSSRRGSGASPCCAREIEEITGDSRTRVSQLVRRANDRVEKALQELQPADVELHPRAARLRELEKSPPRWLRHELGTPPRDRGGRYARGEYLLNWRRAALAIDRYRTLAGFHSETRAFGLRPRDDPFAEAFDTAIRAAEVVGQHRARCREPDQ